MDEHTLSELVLRALTAPVCRRDGNIGAAVKREAMSRRDALQRRATSTLKGTETGGTDDEKRR